MTEVVYLLKASEIKDSLMIHSRFIICQLCARPSEGALHAKTQNSTPTADGPAVCCRKHVNTQLKREGLEISALTPVLTAKMQKL